MSVMMQEMTWQDFNEKKNNAVAILPVGSTEQHGPMLPLSVDAIISTGLAKMVAEKVNGIVFPCVTYGYKSAPLSGGGPAFPGTIDMNGMTLLNLVKDILEELIRDGIKKIFILNGHYENEAFILEAMDLVSRQNEDVTMIESSWWDVMSDGVMEKVFDEVEYPGIELEHAGILETSLTLYFRPDLCKMDRFVEDSVDGTLGYNIYPPSKCEVTETGLLTTARTSTAEKGALLAKDITEAYVTIISNRFD